MIFRVGQRQSCERIIRAIQEICAVNPLGAAVEVWPIEPEYSRAEENTFHWLLDQWLLMDRSIMWSKEMLKKHVLTIHFGAINLVGPSGHEEVIPARTTTQVWDTDRKKYTRKKLSVEQYAALITFLLDFAAEDGTVLPTPTKQKDAA